MLVARSAIAAAAMRKALQATRARLKPAVSRARRCDGVREQVVDARGCDDGEDRESECAADACRRVDERCREARLSRRHAGVGGVLTPTMTKPRSNDMIVRPGNRFPR